MVDRQREKQFFFKVVCDNSGPFSDNYFILIAVSKVLLKILGLTAMLRGSGPLQHPIILLQNKHTSLAENGEILISAQPRISAHSQGPKI